ncbi:MAG: aminotransferase class I/II-fold pyridoxal phosphate-dependent enzyme [Clostridia bacterium]
MESFLSKNVVAIPQSGIRKFFELVQQSKDCIPLVVGEPDFITPSDIRQAAIKAINEGKTQYTSNWGIVELRKAISKYLEHRYNLSYDYNSEIMATIGASEGIDLACRALIEPNDEVLIPDPAYVAYSPCTLLNYGVPKVVKTFEKDGFKVTPENLEAAITPKSKIFVLPYPSNPTGAIMTKDELQAIATVIIKHNLVCISDEIYSELTYGQKHTSIVNIDGMKERTVYISGFSKSFAMTGWRVGYVCAENALLRQMIKIHQFSTVCPATMAQYACVAALEQGYENDYAEIAYMREKYDERRKFVYNELTGMGLSAFEPKGAFYIFPNVSSTGLNGQQFALKILDEKKVAMVPGDAFGKFGENNVRISYAYSMENLKLGMSKIKEFLDSIK